MTKFRLALSRKYLILYSRRNLISQSLFTEKIRGEQFHYDILKRQQNMDIRMARYSVVAYFFHW